MAALPALAQRGRGAASSSLPAQARAPVDLTGYWVAVITEDWRWRMVTAPKGDFASVPLTAEGRRVGLMWDLDQDNATGNQCRAFGVGGVMRQPERLHITWQDSNTLKIETDSGSQTRLLNFGGDPPANAEKTWQGWSKAQWDYGTLIDENQGPDEPVPGFRGSLKVVTGNFRAGYVRRNGVPYSEDATITEYIDRDSNGQDGSQWFHDMTIVDDPKYFTTPFLADSVFKKEPDGSKWHATSCETPPPTAVLDTSITGGR
jgi:hypothetical protein